MFASALFGMLSGSSVANAVTVGSLTIPAMIRLGYPRHFAGGGRSGLVDGRPDHAADHGRRGVPDDRVPRTCRIRPSSSPRSCRPSCTSSACSCRCTSRPRARGCAGSPRTSCPTCRSRSSANWPTLIPLVVAGRHHRQRQHAVPRCVHRHLARASSWGCSRRAQRTTALQYVALLVMHAILVAVITRKFGDYGMWVFVAMVIAVPFVHRALGRESRIGRVAILAAFELGAKYALGRRCRGGHGGHRDRRGHADRRRLQDVVHRHVRRQHAAPRWVAAFLPTGWTNMQTLTLVAALVMTGLVCIAHGLRHSHHGELHHHGDRRGAHAGASSACNRSSPTSSSSTTGCWRTSRHRWRSRPMRRRAWRAPTRSRPATPRFDWGSARRWCRSCSSSRRRCSSW